MAERIVLAGDQYRRERPIFALNRDVVEKALHFLDCDGRKIKLVHLQDTIVPFIVLQVPGEVADAALVFTTRCVRNLTGNDRVRLPGGVVHLRFMRHVDFQSVS